MALFLIVPIYRSVISRYTQQLLEEFIYAHRLLKDATMNTMSQAEGSDQCHLDILPTVYHLLNGL